MFILPFINVRANVEIPQEKAEQIKSELGKAISCIRGKSEAWLMVSIEDGCRLYFRGDGDTPAAFVEVKIYGSAGRAEYDALTAQITAITSDSLSISPDRIYVKYEEVQNWGYNGHNF